MGFLRDFFGTSFGFLWNFLRGILRVILRHCRLASLSAPFIPAFFKTLELCTRAISYYHLDFPIRIIYLSDFAILMRFEIAAYQIIFWNLVAF